MRIDLYLKKTIIIKKREEAKMMCDKNMVKINGRNCKPSKSIKPGDMIEIETARGVRRIKVLSIPEGNVQKNAASIYYEEV